MIGQPERATQNRVIALFRDELRYRYLGDWRDRDDNRNIETHLLTPFLTRTGYSPAQINKAITALCTEADNHSRGLYGNNKAVYSLLRYGVPVKIEAGKVTETVHLINWAEPEKNDFAIAEEVTLFGNLERRPDIVLYVNGISVGVLELKNSRISIGDGIRQSISNQQPQFNAPFFSTVQFIFAGNDSEGLQYGSVGTEEKYFLRWKEDEQDNTRFKLDKYLLKMCAKDRLIELMHDFVLFDGGMKKLPRAPTSISASKRHRSMCAIARAASSGTPRAAAKASSWCCWRNGFWRTTRMRAWRSSLTVTNSTNRLKGSSRTRARPLSAPRAGGT